MKKIVLFLAIIVLLPFGSVAQENKAVNGITFGTPLTNINGFDGAFDSSITVAIGNDDVVERVSFSGAVGFPTIIPIAEEFTNDGNSNFTQGNLLTTPITGARQIYADFDNDGDKDFLVFGSLNGQTSSVGVFLIKKTGTDWLNMTSHGLPALNQLILIIEDFDNDGLLDIFVSGYTGTIGVGYAGWFHNNGNFTFSEMQTFPGLWQSSGDIGDIDWDGDNDIIYTGYNGGQDKMYVLRKNGNTFSVEDISSGQGFIPTHDGFIAFGDKNNDENIDYFASAGSDINGVAVAQFKKADGSGLFDTPLTPPFNPMYKSSLKFTDSNNDGKIEIFAAGFESGGPSVARLYQNSSGDDFPLESTFDGFSDGDVVIADFNSDGFLDVLYTGEEAPFVPILRLYLNESGIDTEDPNAICQNIEAQLDANGNVSIVGTDVDGGSTDNVGIVSYTVSPNTFDCGDIGSNTVTLTVTDAAGNTDTCTATVTVVDYIDPTAIGHENLIVDLNGNDEVTITVDVLDNGSFDNCEITLTLSMYTFTEIGVFDVDLTATDTSSNSDTETYQVTVINTLGIGDFTKKSFVIAPNPVRDILHFEVPSLVQVRLVTIISPLGRIILQTENTNNINVGHLPAGIYFVRVDSEDSGFQVKKIIKQ